MVPKLPIRSCSLTRSVRAGRSSSDMDEMDTSDSSLPRCCRDREERTNDRSPETNPSDARQHLSHDERMSFVHAIISRFTLPRHAPHTGRYMCHLSNAS